MRRFAATCVTTLTCSISFYFALLAALSVVGPPASARAAITPLGDVSAFPPTPPAWASYTTGYIGNTGSGTLTVDGGSDLLSATGYIGYGSSATGVVNIVGTGSTWTTSMLYVGNSGSGTLSISAGAAPVVAVSRSSATTVARRE